MGTTASLALDLGSSSVRGVLGVLEDPAGTLSLREVMRVPHHAVVRDGYLTWDLETITAAVSDAVERATECLGRAPDSLGVDSWGVDYGLLDQDGRLLRAPRSYRDGRTAADEARLERLVPSRTRWERTGTQPARINTFNQLAADLEEEPELVRRVGGLLLMPDLVTYLLGGAAATGRAIASTTGMTMPGATQWDEEMIGRAGIPVSWLPPIVADRSVAGTGPAGTVLVRPGGHDTACAVHSLGLGSEDVALFISCGSWSLVGATLPAAVLGDDVWHEGLTNETRTDGGTRLLRNLTGLWLLQECQRAWAEPDTGALVRAAAKAPSLGVVVDPDDPALAEAGGCLPMPERLACWCHRHYGRRPQGKAQTVRLVLESLACAHARWAEALTRVLRCHGYETTGALRVVGGGVRNRLLMQLTASATGQRVVTGSAEASAAGNLLAQLEVLGAVRVADRGRPLGTARGWEAGVLEPVEEQARALAAMRRHLEEIRPL